MKIEWTPEQTDYAVKLWNEGLSAYAVSTAIKKSFGVHRSRNAVIGRLHRLGHGRPAPASPREAAKKVARALNVVLKRPVYKLPVEPKASDRPQIVADVSNARPWLERAFGQCAFPIGERGAVMSCCAPTEETYCALHRQIMGGRRKPWVATDLVRMAKAA